MKITKTQLRKMIKEEVTRVMFEMSPPSKEDRALGAALSSRLEGMPAGPEKDELRKKIEDLLLTKLRPGGGKKMGPQLYALSHPRNRRD